MFKIRRAVANRCSGELTSLSERVLANFAGGATIPQTLEAFPALSEDDVLAALAFAAASAQKELRPSSAPPLVDEKSPMAGFASEIATAPEAPAPAEIPLFAEESFVRSNTSSVLPSTRAADTFSRASDVKPLWQPVPVTQGSHVLWDFPEERPAAIRQCDT